MSVAQIPVFLSKTRLLFLDSDNFLVALGKIHKVYVLLQKNYLTLIYS